MADKQVRGKPGPISPWNPPNSLREWFYWRNDSPAEASPLLKAPTKVTMGNAVEDLPRVTMQVTTNGANQTRMISVTYPLIPQKSTTGRIEDVTNCPENKDDGISSVDKGDSSDRERGHRRSQSRGRLMNEIRRLRERQEQTEDDVEFVKDIVKGFGRLTAEESADIKAFVIRRAPKNAKQVRSTATSPTKKVAENTTRIPERASNPPPNLLGAPMNKAVKVEHAVEEPYDPYPNSFYDVHNDTVRMYHGAVYGNPRGEPHSAFGMSGPSGASEQHHHHHHQCAPCCHAHPGWPCLPYPYAAPPPPHYPGYAPRMLPAPGIYYPDVGYGPPPSNGYMDANDYCRHPASYRGPSSPSECYTYPPRERHRSAPNHERGRSAPPPLHGPPDRYSRSPTPPRSHTPRMESRHNGYQNGGADQRSDYANGGRHPGYSHNHVDTRDYGHTDEAFDVRHHRYQNGNGETQRGDYVDSGRHQGYQNDDTNQSHKRHQAKYAGQDDYVSGGMDGRRDVYENGGSGDRQHGYQNGGREDYRHGYQNGEMNGRQTGQPHGPHPDARREGPPRYDGPSNGPPPGRPNRRNSMPPPGRPDGPPHVHNQNGGGHRSFNNQPSSRPVAPRGHQQPRAAAVLNQPPMWSETGSERYERELANRSRWASAETPSERAEREAAMRGVNRPTRGPEHAPRQHADNKRRDAPGSPQPPWGDLTAAQSSRDPPAWGYHNYRGGGRPTSVE